MKKIVLMTCSVLAAIVAMTSCNKDYEHYVEPQKVDDPFSGAIPTGYYSYAEISVPAATDMVYVMYKDENGSTKIIEQPVTPKVTVPTDGKQVEPFGTVKLKFQSETPAVVSKVFFTMEEATKAAGDFDDEPYTLENFPVNYKTSGEFGKTRYVQVAWNFYMTNSAATNWQNAPSYPKDVVFYDAEHNHTLRYTFAYPGTVKTDAAYVLTDFYVVEDHVVVAMKNVYCGEGCQGCMKCMPWGCDCGCGGWGPNGSPIYKENPYFEPSGDLTKEAEAEPETIVVDPTTPSETPTGDGGTIIVDANGTIIADYAPADVESIFLPEPASYSNTILDEDGKVKSTTYHSSGVVMFDDRFPSLPDVDYQYDYNDVVIDYDIFALTIADEYLEEEGWREKVKVTMHVRALGGDDGIGVGVVLENFNTDFVDYVDSYATLDSGGHGLLPEWTEGTLQENSLHYDTTPEAGEFKTNNNLRPAVEIGRLQALNSVDGQWSKKTGLNSGNQPYFYENGSTREEHVFNPARKLYAAWGGSHDEQFDPSLDDLYRTTINKKLSDIQNFKLYNTVPGYLNKNGGLYTYTVEYYVKPRAEMSPEDREASLANMIEAVVNTNNQNFYIVKKDHTPVGLKGYEPLDVPAKAWPKGYKARYEEVVAANTDKVDRSTYFLATNGMVWGFKCPTLTRHTWELMPFAVAYPHYKEWVQSKGASHADWYKSDVNTAALVCEW